MPTFKSQAELLQEGDRLFAGLTANTTDLGHLAGSRLKLESTLTQIRELLQRQGAFAASKQEASRQLRELLENGSKLITFLRKGIQEHYGNRSEKLVEFGIQPFRGRVRRPAEPETPTVTPPAPTAAVE